MNGHLGDRAAAYVDGALSPEDEARAGLHLTTCSSCRATVAEQQRVRDRLRRSSEPTAVGGPSLDFMTALASMPTAGFPVRVPPVAAPGSGHRDTLRRGTVAGVAVGATVLASAWGVGGSAALAGPAAVNPDRLVAQHAATAGELPFWGSTSTALRPVSGAARALLERGTAAAAATTYQGVEVITTADATGRHTKVAEVSHIAQRGTSTRLVGAQGSTSASAFRPQSLLERSVGLDAVELLDQTYTLVSEGTEEVAGRDADRVGVYSPDGVLAARFWFDRGTGLPLARELRDRTGTELASSAFAFVSVGDASALTGHLPVATTAGWAESANSPVPGPLESQGWVCPEAVAEAAGMTAFDARLAATTQGPILHLIYTDGLRSVSVFQQRAALDDSALLGFTPSEVVGHPVYRAAGASDVIVWESGDMVFTVVGEADLVDVDAVVAALPHDPAVAGSRTGRGLVRVGSWFDPFG